MFRKRVEKTKTNIQDSRASHGRPCDTNCRPTENHVGSNRSKYNFFIEMFFFVKKKMNKNWIKKRLSISCPFQHTSAPTPTSMGLVTKLCQFKSLEIQLFYLKCFSFLTKEKKIKQKKKDLSLTYFPTDRQIVSRPTKTNKPSQK